MKTFTITIAALLSLCIVVASQAPSLSSASKYAGLYSGTYTHTGKVIAGPAKGAPGISGWGNVTMTIDPSGSLSGMFKGTGGQVAGNVASFSGRINPSGAISVTGTESAKGQNLSGKLTGTLRLTGSRLTGTLNGKSVDANGNVGVVNNTVKLTRH